MAPLNRPHTTYYQSAIVITAHLVSFSSYLMLNKIPRRSLNILPFQNLGMVSYWHSAVTMAVSLTVSEKLSVKLWHSRSLKMVPFNSSYTTYYWSAIVSIALSCTTFEIFDDIVIWKSG